MERSLPVDRLLQEGIVLPPQTQSQAIRTMVRHGSVRTFQNRPLPEEMQTAILTALRSAPSSSNHQLASVIVVTDPSLRASLAVLCGGQAHVASAPVFLLFCADSARAREIADMQGCAFRQKGLELYTLAVMDAALMAQNAQVAAESLGLGTVHIGAVRNDPVAVARLLQLPPGVFGVLGMVAGFPEEPAPIKPRLPATVTIHYNRYHPLPKEELARYDRQMETTRLARPAADAPKWTETVAAWASRETPDRPHLQEVLATLGWPEV